MTFVPFEWQPDVWLLMLGLGFGYWWAVRKLGPRVVDQPAVSRRQIMLFGLGLAVLAGAASWPLDTIGDDYLFSVHMVQYLLLSIVAPPLLLRGLPGWLMRELTFPVRRVVALLARPLIALAIFNGVLVVTHFPPLVQLYATNDLVHFGMHTSWVTAGLLFWLPVLSPVPEYGPLSPPLQMVYLFGGTIFATIPSGFLIWAENPLYDHYARAPRLWGLSPLQDVQLAGVIMKLSGLIVWGVITVIFFRWAAAEMNAATGRSRRTAQPEVHSMPSADHPS